MRFFLDSIGCRLNYSEMESLSRRLAGQCHTLVQNPSGADICILNTCAVTTEAERKSRKAVSRIARQNPNAKIVLTGCYVTQSPEDAKNLMGVTQIVCNQDKQHIPAILGVDGPESNPKWFLPGGRTRAFVQIQDGCDNHCTYCVTTIARGPSVSRPVSEILREIRSLANAGYKEVVLTGVNLGAFEIINPDKRHNYSINPNQYKFSLHSLIQMILSETDIPRLRLSSIEPWDIDPEFFGLWDNPRLCRQLHLPLQSGSNSVLKRMGRRLSGQVYSNLVKAAHSTIPGLSLTTDVIIGFPAETSQEHLDSLSFVRSCRFARLHVFSFSARPGTVAYHMPDQIKPQVIKTRSLEMRQLGKEMQRHFLACFIGQTMDVLWESSDRDGNWKGHTDNYIQINTWSKKDLRNTITPTKLVELLDTEIRGTIISKVDRG